MEQERNEIARISRHLDELNREHKRKRIRQMSILGGIAVVFLLIGIFVSRMFLGTSSNTPAFEPTEEIIAFENLSPNKVREYFATHEGGLIVKLSDPEQYITLFSEQDYWDLVDHFAGRTDAGYEFLAENPAGYSSTDDTLYLDNGTLDPFVPLGDDEVFEPVEEAPLSTESRIIIQGVRSAENSLRFSISNFDPRMTYEIDFGDGTVEEAIGREFFHTYNKGGLYTVDLKGFYGGTEMMSVSRNVSIDASGGGTPPVVSQNTAAQPASNLMATRDNSTSQDVSELPEEEGNAISSLEAPSLELTLDKPEPNLPNRINPTTSRSEALVPAVATPEVYRDPSQAQTGNQPIRRYKKTFRAPLKIANQMPQFPGGNVSLLTFLNERLRYPQAAKDFNIEGDVFVQFVVDEEGSIRDMSVIRGLGYGCDKEALRIVKEMPKWIPGRHNGEVVPVIYTIPINFRLI